MVSSTADGRPFWPMEFMWPSNAARTNRGRSPAAADADTSSPNSADDFPFRLGGVGETGSVSGSFAVGSWEKIKGWPL